jgi:hypothetical protein
VNESRFPHGAKRRADPARNVVNETERGK